MNQIHSDASFRSYYRIIDAEKGSFIVMESDPSLEDNKKFERILSLLEQVSMPVPKIYENCLLYTSPSPRDLSTSRMPSSA